MPSDAELVAALAASVGAVARLERRPHAYATSHPLEQLRVELADGRGVELLLKDLRRERLPEAARRAKPRFLDDPTREVDTYRRILEPAVAATPRLQAADGSWLVLERVPGVELWQVGDLEVWRAVARSLGDLHRRLAPYADEAHLLRYDRRWYGLWLDRARAAVPAVAAAARAHERAVELLLAEPKTVIHGELYASNVLVAGERVCLVDWETAARGPGVVDLAALTTGWDDADRAAMVEAYGDVAGDTLHAARLHLAVRWLGWSRDWRPPAEHRRDWLAEALEAGSAIGT